MTPGSNRRRSDRPQAEIPPLSPGGAPVAPHTLAPVGSRNGVPACADVAAIQTRMGDGTYHSNTFAAVLAHRILEAGDL